MESFACKHFAEDAREEILHSIGETQPHAEECAYRWFLRFAVLRCMECNQLLPKPCFPHNFISSPEEEHSFRGQLMQLCRTVSGFPMLSPLFADADCEQLHEPLLTPDGFLSRLLSIPEEEWTAHPELLGWLHQYYHSFQKDTAFSQLHSGKRIKAELIPAATQTFTPEWLTKYMTENALSSLWQAIHPEKAFPCSRQYFVPDAAQSPDADAALRALLQSRRGSSVRELTILDPCMGTGHILACAFDLLLPMYAAEGTPQKEAVRSILTHNLYGLDIDSKAAFLAKIILLCKAARCDASLLFEEIPMHIADFSGLPDSASPQSEEEHRLFAAFKGCESFGSLLMPPAAALRDEDCLSAKPFARMRMLSAMLTMRYDAVITNPPYMGSSNMHAALSAFVKEHYPDSKSDLFAAFMERCAALTAPSGCFAMLTQHAWMFLSSYRTLRKKMEQYTIRSMVHLGAKAFSAADVGTIVQATAFVCMGSRIPEWKSTYLRLTDAEDKAAAFFEPERRYVRSSSLFEEIPGSPLCYWISDALRKTLSLPRLDTHCKICQGMTTSDNKRFLRFWFEVPFSGIAFGCKNAAEAAATGKTWFPYNKGGKSRRWYGGHLHIINYRNNGEELRAFHSELNRVSSGGRIKNAEQFFLPALTWQFITQAEHFSVRFQPEGFLFDVSGSSLFPKEEDTLYLLGLLSSCVTRCILEIYNPTMNFQVENLSALPVRFDPQSKPEIERLVSENITLARNDWNQQELSWEFRAHPLIAIRQECPDASLEEIFQQWENRCSASIQTMQRNEEAINRHFLRIYGLEDTLSPTVPEESVTLHRASKEEDLRSLMSFIIGCIFGRFHTEGFAPDFRPGGILTPEEAALQTEHFLCAVFGREHLPENLQFLTSFLQGEGSPREKLAQYLSSGFYADHCRRYQHRPIYWITSCRHCRGLMYVHDFGDSPVPVLLQTVSAIREEQEQALRRLRQKDAAAKRHTALRQSIRAAEKQCTALQEYEHALLALQDVRYLPDDGISANHERFSSVFSAVR